MPNCVQLYKKGSPTHTEFADVDDEICRALNVEPHPVKFYLDWYDSIGLMLATGNTLEECKEIFKDCGPEFMAIVNYLAEHYTADAWYEMK